MAKPPVILQIIPGLDTGGAERTVIDVAEAIVAGGGQALVACEGGRLAGELAEAGGALIPFPAGAKNPLRILSNARRLEALIRARGVDLVHARSRAPAWSALIAARRAGKPFVTTYHGIYNQKTALKRWYNGVMARGDIVIANSHHTARMVRERHGLPEDRLRIIPRGVDHARFAPDQVGAERIARLRESWGVPPEARLVMQAARLTRWKGQDVLIAAAALLSEQSWFRDVRIVLAGDDQGRTAYREALLARIARAGLNGRVILAGHCADMPAAFAAAQLAVVPSIEPEAFGRVSVEAQAMGCPVIVSEIGALPETLRRSGDASGWVVPPADPGALAQAMAMALGLSPTQRARMNAAARANAATFSKTALQRKTLQVYDALLNSRLSAPYLHALGSAEYAGERAV